MRATGDIRRRTFDVWWLVVSLPRRRFDVNDLPDFNHISSHRIEVIE
jgi:hypothetical protein